MAHYETLCCDDEGEYRYSLRIGTEASRSRQLTIIQCNPSDANASRSDPTVGKVSRWAAEHEFGIITFLNLFAYRSSKVRIISGMPYDRLVGARNDYVIRENCEHAVTVICAWGGTLPVANDLYLRRLHELQNVLGNTRLFKVGALVRGKYPRHGRMWNKNQRTKSSLLWADLLS